MIFTKTTKKSDTSVIISRCAACDVGRMVTTLGGAPSSQRKSLNACSAWEITLENIVIALCVSNATRWGIGSKIARLICLSIKPDADFAARKDTPIGTVVYCKLSSLRRALIWGLSRTRSA